MIPYLDRINQLAQKAKEQELSASELQERDTLRTQYVAAIRGQVLESIAGLTILDADGQNITPHKLIKMRQSI